jgi:hypothetical protein
MQPLFASTWDKSESAGDFAQSFVAQKNFLLLDKLLNPSGGSLTSIAMQYVNFCDESFDVFLNDRIAACETEGKKQVLGKIRYEVNVARQKKLMEADKMLRGILAAGGLKQMEAKVQSHLRKSDIDMAFMVILHLNIEDAIAANAETAVQIMTHIRTLIVEHQDAVVSAPVRLLRRLVRTDDPTIRKQMLRQKLSYGDISQKQECSTQCTGGASASSYDQRHDHAHSHEHSHDYDHNHKHIYSSQASSEPQATTTPQCESIVVQPVQRWGGADVTVAQLEDTITDVLSQVMASTPSIRAYK